MSDAALPFYFDEAFDVTGIGHIGRYVEVYVRPRGDQTPWIEVRDNSGPGSSELVCKWLADLREPDLPGGVDPDDDDAIEAIPTEEFSAWLDAYDDWVKAMLAGYVERGPYLVWTFVNNLTEGGYDPKEVTDTVKWVHAKAMAMFDEWNARQPIGRVVMTGTRREVLERILANSEPVKLTPVATCNCDRQWLGGGAVIETHARGCALRIEAGR